METLSRMRSDEKMSTLPNTEISLGAIASAFGGGSKAAPHRLNEFYKGGTYVADYDEQPNVIPTAGTIGIGNFRGARRAPVYNPFMWYSAKSLTGLAHGATVSSWNSITNGKVATGYGAGMGAPTLDKTSEAHPFVRLGSGSASTTVGNYFDCGGQTMNIATNGGFTCVAMVRLRGPVGTWERLIDFNNGVNNNNLVLARSVGTNFWAMSYRNGATNSDNQMSIGVSGGWQTLGFRFVSGEQAMFDTGVKSTAGNLTMQDRAFTYTWIGRSAWTDAYANMDVRDVLFYDKALTDTQIGDVRSYLISRYA